ncbi:hypothetical protein V8E36_000977 [Tilletia maclaganii]
MSHFSRGPGGAAAATGSNGTPMNHRQWGPASSRPAQPPANINSSSSRNNGSGGGGGSSSRIGEEHGRHSSGTKKRRKLTDFDDDEDEEPAEDFETARRTSSSSKHASSSNHKKHSSSNSGGSKRHRRHSSDNDDDDDAELYDYREPIKKRPRSSNEVHTISDDDSDDHRRRRSSKHHDDNNNGQKSSRLARKIVLEADDDDEDEVEEVPRRRHGQEPVASSTPSRSKSTLPQVLPAALEPILLQRKKEPVSKGLAAIRAKKRANEANADAAAAAASAGAKGIVIPDRTSSVQGRSIGAGSGIGRPAHATASAAANNNNNKSLAKALPSEVGKLYDPKDIRQRAKASAATGEESSIVISDSDDDDAPAGPHNAAASSSRSTAANAAQLGAAASKNGSGSGAAAASAASKRPITIVDEDDDDDFHAAANRKRKADRIAAQQNKAAAATASTSAASNGVGSSGGGEAIPASSSAERIGEAQATPGVNGSATVPSSGLAAAADSPFAGIDLFAQNPVSSRTFSFTDLYSDSNTAIIPSTAAAGQAGADPIAAVAGAGAGAAASPIDAGPSTIPATLDLGTVGGVNDESTNDALAAFFLQGSTSGDPEFMTNFAQALSSVATASPAVPASSGLGDAMTSSSLEGVLAPGSAGPAAGVSEPLTATVTATAVVVNGGDDGAAAAGVDDAEMNYQDAADALFQNAGGFDFGPSEGDGGGGLIDSFGLLSEGSQHEHEDDEAGGNEAGAATDKGAGANVLEEGADATTANATVDTIVEVDEEEGPIETVGASAASATVSGPSVEGSQFSAGGHAQDPNETVQETLIQSYDVTMSDAEPVGEDSDDEVAEEDEAEREPAEPASRRSDNPAVDPDDEANGYGWDDEIGDVDAADYDEEYDYNEEYDEEGDEGEQDAFDPTTFNFGLNATNEGRALSHRETWNDSALVDAWDASKEEYEIFHAQKEAALAAAAEGKNREEQERAAAEAAEAMQRHFVEEANRLAALESSDASGSTRRKGRGGRSALWKDSPLPGSKTAQEALEAAKQARAAHKRKARAAQQAADAARAREEQERLEAEALEARKAELRAQIAAQEQEERLRKEAEEARRKAKASMLEKQQQQQQAAAAAAEEQQRKEQENQHSKGSAAHASAATGGNKTLDSDTRTSTDDGAAGPVTPAPDSGISTAASKNSRVPAKPAPQVFAVAAPKVRPVQPANVEEERQLAKEQELIALAGGPSGSVRAYAGAAGIFAEKQNAAWKIASKAVAKTANRVGAPDAKGKGKGKDGEGEGEDDDGEYRLKADEISLARAVEESLRWGSAAATAAFQPVLGNLAPAASGSTNRDGAVPDDAATRLSLPSDELATAHESMTKNLMMAWYWVGHYSRGVDMLSQQRVAQQQGAQPSGQPPHPGPA